MAKYKYKVVKTRNNKSCIVNANSEFCLTYEKDTTVSAPEGTLGIMVFKTRTEAENWIELWERERSWKIKRVIPTGRGKTPLEICSTGLTKDLRIFYNHIKSLFRLSKGYKQEIIPGTICYPEVFVVD